MKQLRRPALLLCTALLVTGVVTAGAISGSKIGASAVVERPAKAASIGHKHTAKLAEPPRRIGKQLPDHYPLVTPTGTIPVAALAAHGRFLGKRAGWQDSAGNAALGAQYPDQLGEAEIDRLAQWSPAPRRVPRDDAVRVHTPRGVRIEVGESAAEYMPDQQVAAAAIKTAQAAQQVAPPTDGSAQ